jgi:hypothetical protein
MDWSGLERGLMSVFYVYLNSNLARKVESCTYYVQPGSQF